MHEDEAGRDLRTLRIRYNYSFPSKARESDFSRVSSLIPDVATRCVSRARRTRGMNERMKSMSDKAVVRTLRTFQVFRAAYKFHTGEQGYTAREQHREATQIHVSLPTGLRRSGVPTVT